MKWPCQIGSYVYIRIGCMRTECVTTNKVYASSNGILSVGCLLPRPPVRWLGHTEDYAYAVSEAEQLEHVESLVDEVSDIKQNAPRSSVPGTRGRYIISDPEWAWKVTRKIRRTVNFRDPQNLIVECTPGNGVLTRALLYRSKAKVVGLQYRQSTSPKLLELMENRYFKSKLHLHTGSILSIRHMLKYMEDPDCIDRLSPEQLSPVKVIGMTFPMTRLPSYVNMLSFELGARNHLYSLGRVESFLLVPSTELLVIGHKKDYQLFHRGALRSALYKVFFDVKVMLKIPPEAFCNKPRNTGGAGGDKNVYLVRIVPRHPLACPPEGVPALIHLLRELRKRRGKTVQQTVDSLYPDLTPAVISEGASDDDLISYLTVPQVLSIYKVLSSRLENLNFDHDEDDDS